VASLPLKPRVKTQSACFNSTNSATRHWRTTAAPSLKHNPCPTNKPVHTTLYEPSQHFDGRLAIKEGETDEILAEK
jgi:hypothetical protein